MVNWYDCNQFARVVVAVRITFYTVVALFGAWIVACFVNGALSEWNSYRDDPILYKKRRDHHRRLA